MTIATLACMHASYVRVPNPYAVELGIVVGVLIVGAVLRHVAPRRAPIVRPDLIFYSALCLCLGAVAMVIDASETRIVCGSVLVTAIGLTVGIYADVFERYRRDPEVPRAIVNAVGGARRWWRRR